MKETTKLTNLLRDADPLEHDADGVLSPTDAQRMRRQVLAAALEPEAVVRLWWTRPLAVATAVILMIGLAGVVGDRQQPASNAPAYPTASVVPLAEDPPRQLQFSTPGGTRIIWVFDENLRLQEPMP